MEIGENKLFRYIPIIVTKVGEFYHAEISDKYENYKPQIFKDINFEDLAFHFMEIDDYRFSKRKDALVYAKHICKILKEKGLTSKVWIIT